MAQRVPPDLPDAPTQLRLAVSYLPVDQLRLAKGSARKHPQKQLVKIQGAIQRFGFLVPILIGAGNTVIVGNARLMAARMAGLAEVPVIMIDHLTEAEVIAFSIADNRLAEDADWDADLLRDQFNEIVVLDSEFELELTGFDTAEIDLILDPSDKKPAIDRADLVPALGTGRATTQLGDVWVMKAHRLVCGDARDPKVYAVLLQNGVVRAVFTDPPWNVPIHGHVSGLGATQHGEFVMASGEMSKAEFQAFLDEVLLQIAAVCGDGAIAYVCMDWRHMGEVLRAGEKAFTSLKNLIVWGKTNAGMGSFYRSQHELIFVFKKGTAPHINTFGLGETGRYRTNLWSYAGCNTFGPRRDDELGMHPTVKPVVMIADAIKDVTRRGDIVLDAFGGSGSTLMAAEKTGRAARLVELDPQYCDVICRRFAAYAKVQPILEATGQTFDEVAAERRAEAAGEPGQAPASSEAA